MKRSTLLLLVAVPVVAVCAVAVYARFASSPTHKAPSAEEVAAVPGCKEMNQGKRRVKRPKGEALVLAKLPGTFKVRCVIDGDTFEIEFQANGETRRDKIRVLGFNSPETVDKRAGKTIQCFGAESSAYAKWLLTGKTVRLEPDPTQFERDNFHRLVAYVYLPDGTLYNLHMLKGGYGHEYTFQTPYQRQAEFRAAEEAAKKKRLGVWKSDECAIASAQKKRPS